MRLSDFSSRYFGKAVNGGKRPASDITTIVIHDTEGPTAEGGARTLTTRTDASAHLVVDDDNTFRLLADDVVAWTQRWNQHALAIEQAGYARWSLRTWLSHLMTIRRAAYWSAYWCSLYKIPVRWRSTEDLNAGQTHGLTSHNNVSRSTLSDSTHTDPGPNYPIRGKTSYMALVKVYRARFATRSIRAPRSRE